MDPQPIQQIAPTIIVQGYSFWQFAGALVVAVLSGGAVQFLLRRNDRKAMLRALLVEVKYILRRLDDSYDGLRNAEDRVDYEDAIWSLAFTDADITVFKDSKTALGGVPIALADKIVKAYSRLQTLKTHKQEDIKALEQDPLNVLGHNRRVEVLILLKNFEVVQTELMVHTSDTWVGKWQLRAYPVELYLRLHLPRLMRKAGIKSRYVRRVSKWLHFTGVVRFKMPDEADYHE